MNPIRPLLWIQPNLTVSIFLDHPVWSSLVLYNLVALYRLYRVHRSRFIWSCQNILYIVQKWQNFYIENELTLILLSGKSRLKPFTWVTKAENNSHFQNIFFRYDTFFWFHCWTFPVVAEGLTKMLFQPLCIHIQMHFFYGFRSRGRL